MCSSGVCGLRVFPGFRILFGIILINVVFGSTPTSASESSVMGTLCNVSCGVFPELRMLSNSLIEARLHEADLGWLPRRKKSKVSGMYLEPRIEYYRMVLRMQQKLLDKWCYFDGTVYYLETSHSIPRVVLRLSP